MPTNSLNQDEELSILERTRLNDGRGSESFEPSFSPELDKFSAKIGNMFSKTRNSYKGERKKFGGQPLSWEE